MGGCSQKLPKGFAFVVFARFVSNVAYRMVFPFLPTIARGIGVSTATLGTTLALRDLVEISGPALGKLTDRQGLEELWLLPYVVWEWRRAFKVLVMV